MRGKGGCVAVEIRTKGKQEAKGYRTTTTDLDNGLHILNNISLSPDAHIMGKSIDFIIQGLIKKIEEVVHTSSRFITPNGILFSFNGTSPPAVARMISRTFSSAFKRDPRHALNLRQYRTATNSSEVLRDGFFPLFTRS